MYPNAAKGVLHIKSPTNQSTQLIIYDGNGRSIMSKTIAGQSCIDVSLLPSPVYSISAKPSLKIDRQKFVNDFFSKMVVISGEMYKF